MWRVRHVTAVGFLGEVHTFVTSGHTLEQITGFATGVQIADYEEVRVAG